VSGVGGDWLWLLESVSVPSCDTRCSFSSDSKFCVVLQPLRKAFVSGHCNSLMELEPCPVFLYWGTDELETSF
jgi:hypothetical protein